MHVSEKEPRALIKLSTRSMTSKKKKKLEVLVSTENRYIGKQKGIHFKSIQAIRDN